MGSRQPGAKPGFFIGECHLTSLATTNHATTTMSIPYTEDFIGRHHNLIRLMLGDNIDRGFFEDVELIGWMTALDHWFGDFIADLIFDGDITLAETLPVDRDHLAMAYLDWAASLEDDRRANLAYQESN